MLADRTLCTGCSSCASICPNNCIQMVPNSQGFLYPYINKEICVNCGLCEKSCPIITPSILHSASSCTAFAAYITETAIRQESSSGGLFTLIASHVINLGGVVFGACFDNNQKVIHTYSETLTGLQKFRGSKYVQSDIGNSFSTVKKFLTEGRIVLFSGTPCQVGGLHKFLGKEYPNLISLDFVCHGIPAPAIWQKYLAELSQKFKSPVKAVSFRDKRFGWKSYCVRLDFENGKTYLAPPALDPYMRSFLSDLTLRSSCFHCKFKGSKRISDFTLADFWGIEHVYPTFDDNQGTSLILIHNEKASLFLSKLTHNVKISEVDSDIALKLNPSALKSATTPVAYSRFADDIQNSSFFQTVEKHCKIPLILKFKLKLHFIIKCFCNSAK